MVATDPNEYIREHYQQMSNRELAAETGLTISAVEHRIQRLGLIRDTKSSDTKLIDMLKSAIQTEGIALSDIGGIEKVKISRWEMGSKDEDGNPQVTPLSGTQFIINPSFKSAPDWPLVQQAKPTVIKPASTPKHTNTYKVAVVLPDPQIGFRRDDLTGELDPFHDEQALSIALQITRSLNPDLVVNLGDFVDLPEMSRFEQEPAFARTMQPAIDRAHRFLAEQRACAPHAEIRLIEGNHDRRITKSIIANAMAAFGLRQANAPDSWPVLSIPFLLRLDELGIKYIEGYPAGSTWINDRLKCIHGHIVRSGGSTARAVSDDERVSTIFGHIHRIEVHYKSVNVRDGVRTNLAVSPGCLCRIDGAVPSTKSSTDLRGQPVKSFENWQQGLAVVTYEEGDGAFSVEPVYINSGTALFRGKLYTG